MALGCILSAMRLTELFTPEDLILGFAPDDKWDALGKLIEHLVRSERLTADEAPGVRDAVLARERSMSTGMENGIAIPHAAVDGLSEIAVALGIVQDEAGLDFESIDGQPTRLVVLLVIPKAQKLLHIRTLADVARVLGKDSVREELLSAETCESAWYALRTDDA
ncbi:MAG TPA: PTS sugar transporter subunit IIA [Planctomycetes bacterium]|jgi:mannitol/fructose-specific phosphotransferase system IIA component (Ntr-type)|nr:PTS sugar transporter subunit IIA [Planctomycetota bacterium]